MEAKVSLQTAGSPRRRSTSKASEDTARGGGDAPRGPRATWEAPTLASHEELALDCLNPPSADTKNRAISRAAPHPCSGLVFSNSVSKEDIQGAVTTASASLPAQGPAPWWTLEALLPAQRPGPGRAQQWDTKRSCLRLDFLFGYI